MSKDKRYIKEGYQPKADNGTEKFGYQPSKAEKTPNPPKAVSGVKPKK